jgi:ABC-2 type transport system ATP-binding protein
LIEVKNVTKKYGDFYAVRNINFEIKDGEIVGFLGRNGAGKSTTMNMITGFIEPTEGDIIVNGYDIDQNPKKVKSQIGYMPEGTPLYSDLTVKEFVTYMAELKMVPKKERKAAVEKAIESTGLTKVQKSLTRSLSRGYKQRVSMAGAIVGDPKIIILDEPTVGLDPKQVIEIRDLIKSFRKDHTVLISSHILSEISQICEKVIIIDKGEIVAIDTPEHLENKTTEKTILSITVDDMNDKFMQIKDEIPEITSIKLVKENDDSTKEYVIETESKNDLRKSIFASCAKNEVIIIEMKKSENSLEDAFIKLVEDRPEYSKDEIKKIQYDKEIEELREEELANKEAKENKKQAKKEAKARKNADKEAKKEAKQKIKEEKKEASSVENKEDEKKDVSSNENKEDVKNEEGGDK